MKRLALLIAVQALFAAVSGYLFSRMSFIGRMGISITFRDYAILKVWWKTAILLFTIQLALLLLLSVSGKWAGRKLGQAVAGVMLIFAFVGAYLTYVDFTHTTHKLMKFYFHAGGYLFWAAWACSCLYFLLLKRKPAPEPLPDPDPAVV